MEVLEVTKYVKIVKIRKWWVILPALTSILAGLGYYLHAPKVYEAETLILVEPPRVPANLVRPIMESDIQDRLRTLTQQVTSRTNLEAIVKEHDLYAETNLILEDKVERLRKKINLKVDRSGRGGGAFKISFVYGEPKVVMDVTNDLASKFIVENLKVREDQVMGTSLFLSDELESIRQRLLEKEEQLKIYREQNMGGLPEQLQTNLSILQRLQAQVDQLTDSLRDAENRKIALQRELAEAKSSPAAYFSLPGVSQAREVQELVTMKNELASLESRYTQSHPDVVRLKETIARMEAALRQKEGGAEKSSSQELPAFSLRADDALKKQLQEIELEVSRLKEDINQTRAKIALYERRVEETPKREQELLSLNRDYANVRDLYNSLLNRKLESELAVSMERKQKGEQFRVIDPAKRPDRPVSPDFKKIFMMAIALGLGAGGGLAFLRETLDTSYKTPYEAEKDLQLPVLLSIPITRTEKELKRIRFRNALAYTSVGVGFLASAAAIILATKGVDKTVEFVKDLVEKV